MEGPVADGASIDHAALARAIARIPLLEAVVAHLDDREALQAFGRTLGELRAVVDDAGSADDARDGERADEAADPDVLRTLYAELAAFWEPFEELIEDLPADTAAEDA